METGTERCSCCRQGTARLQMGIRRELASPLLPYPPSILADGGQGRLYQTVAMTRAVVASHLLPQGFSVFVVFPLLCLENASGSKLL